ncbi:unnamed protein product [Arabidopsis lyrata]|nr:unnamed protein product [Arabidopsis lyrata]
MRISIVFFDALFSCHFNLCDRTQACCSLSLYHSRE